MADIYQLSGWGYALDNVDPMRFSVHPSFKIETPEVLYKYYRVNEYSIDSLINRYLYASHPFELNDPFDCFSYLLDFSNISLETYKRFFCTFTNASESYVIKLYNSNIEKLNKYFIGQFFDFLLARIGVISLTENPEDMLMWTHYSSHTGFVLVFNVSELEELFHGPFPINYVEHPETFDINIDPHLSILYLTNIKSKCWLYENEWRLIAERAKPMKLPNRSDLSNLDERKFLYPKSTLKEIILGFDFFIHDLCVGEQDGYYIFDFIGPPDSDLRIRLLNFIIENGFVVSLIHLNNNLGFKLTKKEIAIKYFSATKFGYKLKGPTSF
jgi:hypothetical protein